MATIYLHIGPPKTGTTTIQNFLWDNRGILENYNICFPDLGYRYSSADFHRNGHFLTKRSAAAKREARQYEEGLDRVQELGKKFSRIILSDEGLWLEGTIQDHFWERLADDLRKRDLKLCVTMYFRPQDLWVQSFWAQKVKAGKTALCFRDYLEQLRETGYPMDYCAYLDRLAGIFGKDALIVRVLESGQFRGPEQTLISDFMSIFGLSLSDGFQVARETYNTKFSGTYLEIKRILNAIPEFQNDKKNAVIAALIKIRKMDPFGHDFSKYSFFAAGEQKAFRDSFSDSNQRLAREYLGRADGVLFCAPVIDLPELIVDDRDLLRDITLLYGSMLQDMIQKNEEQKKTILSLQNDLEKLSRKVADLETYSLLYRLKNKIGRLMKK